MLCDLDFPPSLRILNPSKIQSAKFEWSDFCNRNFGDYLDSSLVLTPPKGSTTQQKKFDHFNLQLVAAKEVYRSSLAESVRRGMASIYGS